MLTRMTDAGAAAPADPALRPAIALVICAVVIFIAILSKSWVTAGARDFEIHVGPIGIEACMASVCRDPGRMGDKLDGDISLFQTLALLGGFASVAAAGAFGGMTIAGKRDRLPSWKLANVAFVLAAFGMSYFEVRVLSKGHGAGLGWAVFPGLGGVIAAGVFIRKLKNFLPGPQLQPIPPQPQPQPPPQAPMPQAAPPCPRCGTPLEFVHQYQRWFCPREQQYV